MVQSETNKKESKKQSYKFTTNDSSNDKTSSPRCSHCGSKNVYGISRVVGYYSVIDNWNKSKQAELKSRQKGNYWSDNSS